MVSRKAASDKVIVQPATCLRGIRCRKPPPPLARGRSEQVELRDVLVSQGGLNPGPCVRATDPLREQLSLEAQHSARSKSYTIPGKRGREREVVKQRQPLTALHDGGYPFALVPPAP